MATAGPRRPFVRNGIVYPSQYAYRQALAAQRGFASRRQMVRATQEAARTMTRELQNLPAPQRGRVAAELAAWRQQNPQGLGTFVEGVAKSNQLPPDLLNYLRSLGGTQYPIWRLLYARS